MKRYRILRSGSREVVAVVETRNASSAVIAKEAELGLPPCSLFYEVAPGGERAPRDEGTRETAPSGAGETRDPEATT